MLPETNDTLTATLNDLVRVCKDSEERFLSTADRAYNSELKQLFNEYSLERAQFASRLQWEVTHAGGDPESSSSFAETLRRGVRSLKSVITRDSDISEIETCEQAERAALQEYRRALRGGLPDDVRKLVAAQRSQIQDTEAVLRKLKESLENERRKS